RKSGIGDVTFGCEEPFITSLPAPAPAPASAPGVGWLTLIASLAPAPGAEAGAGSGCGRGNRYQINPKSIALNTARVRSRTPNFESTDEMWFFTVPSEMLRSSEISRLL